VADVAVALLDRFGIIQMKDSAILFHREVEVKFKKCRRFYKCCHGGLCPICGKTSSEYSYITVIHGYSLTL